jgi:hypothetical protein
MHRSDQRTHERVLDPPRESVGPLNRRAVGKPLRSPIDPPVLAGGRRREPGPLDIRHVAGSSRAQHFVTGIPERPRDRQQWVSMSIARLGCK